MSDDETTPRFNNQLSELKKQRGVLKGRLTLFANYVNKLDQSCLDSTTITHLQMRVHSAAIFFSEFNDIQSKIERIFDEKDLLLHLEYRESFECQYYSISALAKQMLGDGEQSESTKNNNSQCSKSVCIKLPQIKLPVFDGSFDKWLEFRNSYVSMIHDRSDLDSIQKFQYLKSSLSGSALHVISSLEFTAANYVNAWDLLEARYHNNKLLINNHIKALFAAPPLGKECPAQIRSLVDCVLRNLRALNSLIDSDSSLEDLLIIYLVVSKLDSATEREWENYRSSLTDSNKPSKPVKLEDLLSFLNSRSDMLDMINSGKKNSNSQINKQPTDNKRQSNNINSQTTLSYASANNNNKVSSGKSKHNRHNVTCPLCTDKHALYSCVKFLNMLVQDRLKFAKTKGVCLICLRSSTHTIENCNFGPCKLCQQKHNALIHVDNSVIPNTSQNSVINDTLPQSSVLHCVSKTADNIDNRSVVFSNNINSLQTVLLSTALVEIADIDNTYHTVRALLDSGSQNCFISQELCKRLKLPIIQSTIRICGVGQSVSQSNHKCDINMRSKMYDFNTTLHCLVLPSIISKLPSTHVIMTL
nr:uncharacterized protein LOC126053879 [Helicoverpa armigera]